MGTSAAMVRGLCILVLDQYIEHRNLNRELHVDLRTNLSRHDVTYTYLFAPTDT